MTHIYQSPDLTVNRSAKDFTKRIFTSLYQDQLDAVLESAQDLADIQIPFQLSVLKQLNSQWLVDIFNHMMSDRGQETVLNGWKKSGILSAVNKGSLLKIVKVKYAGEEPLQTIHNTMY